MENQTKKSLSTFQLSAIIGSLTILGLFLLFMAGLFDKVEVSDRQQLQNKEHNHNKAVKPETINEINRLEETVKANPKNHEALLKLANLLNDSGFYSRAIDNYAKYLSNHPDNADVIVDMGICYFELEQFDKSISIIESALKVNPKHQIAHFNLGIVNLANKDIATAREWWQKTIDINPNTNIGQKAKELLKTHN